MLLVFLPTQLGLHFWPKSAFVSGIQIDYLSPTLYFTDVILFFLLGMLLFSVRPFKLQVLKTKKPTLLLVNILVVFLFASTILANNLWASMLGLLRFFEIVGFALLTKYIFEKDNFSKKLITYSIGLSLVGTSLLSIAQFIKQEYIGGALYYLGERAIFPITPGAATVVIDGAFMLRPYGTFSHPNVLAGFLLIMTIFLFSNRLYFYAIHRYLFFVIWALASVAIFLTMSRVVIVAYAVYYIYVTFKELRSYDTSNSKAPVIALSIIALIGLIIYATYSHDRFTLDSLSGQTLQERLLLIQAAFVMVQNNFLFGVGLLNFIPELAKISLQSNHLHILQPVHNVLLLLLAELGIVNTSILLYFFVTKLLSVHKTRKHQVNSIGAILLSVIFLSCFDHYFLTSQQGRLLLGFILGLLYSLKTDKKNLIR